MRHFLQTLAVTFLLALPALAQTSLAPVEEAHNLMVNFGKLAPADGPWSATASPEKGGLKISRATEYGSTAVSFGDWQAGVGWLVYIENENRVWAYDGKGWLLLVSTMNDGGVETFQQNYPAAVPAEVSTRLPEHVRHKLKTTLH